MVPCEKSLDWSLQLADVTSVRDALEVRFAAQRVVFWHDPSGEYETELDSLDLGDGKIIRVKADEFGAKGCFVANHVNKYLEHWWLKNSPLRSATKTASTRPFQPSPECGRATPNSAWQHCFSNRHQGSWRLSHHRNRTRGGRVPHGPSTALVETINGGKRISN